MVLKHLLENAKPRKSSNVSVRHTKKAAKMNGKRKTPLAANLPIETGLRNSREDVD